MEEKTTGPSAPECTATHLCLTCQTPTTYKYVCEHCSEAFLIELWNGGRELGLRP
jgi:hypothetical protein